MVVSSSTPTTRSALRQLRCSVRFSGYYIRAILEKCPAFREFFEVSEGFVVVEVDRNCFEHTPSVAVESHLALGTPSIIYNPNLNNEMR